MNATLGFLCGLGIVLLIVIVKFLWDLWRHSGKWDSDRKDRFP